MLEKVNVAVRPKIGNEKVRVEETIDPASCICFQGGILGFPGIINYLLIPYEAGRSFFRLQAADQADLSFIVVDPLSFASDYQPNFSVTDLENLEIGDSESMVLLAIVSIPKNKPQAMTANLMAPLVINAQLRKGKQIVLSNSEYAIREAIFKLA